MGSSVGIFAIRRTLADWQLDFFILSSVAAVVHPWYYTPPTNDDTPCDVLLLHLRDQRSNNNGKAENKIIEILRGT